MKPEALKKTLELLAQFGVEYYRQGDFEVRFKTADVPMREYSPVSAAALPEKSPIGNIPNSKRATAPATGAAIPPVEVNIPHHPNEVASLLKLSDYELAERMFPDYSQGVGDAAGSQRKGS